MSSNFTLITKEKIEDFSEIEDVYLSIHNGYHTFSLNISHYGAVSFLEQCLSQTHIDNILGSEFKCLLELIDVYKLKNFVIDYENDFAGMPCDDEFRVAFIDGFVQKSSLLQNQNRSSIKDYRVMFKQLGVDPSDLI